MKTLLLLCLLALPTFAQEVKYDKFKDQTLVSGDTVRIVGVTMAAKAIHPGQVADSVNYYLVFRHIGRTWAFLRSRDLIFIADGQRIELGRGSHDGDIRASRYSSGVTEVMIYQIDRADLEILAKAASLEMKLGAMEAKLDDKDKKGIREVLSYK